MDIMQLMGAYIVGLAGMFAFMVILIALGVRLDEKLRKRPEPVTRVVWTAEDVDRYRESDPDKPHYLS